MKKENGKNTVFDSSSADTLRDELVEILEEISTLLSKDSPTSGELAWVINAVWWVFCRNSYIFIKLFDEKGLYYPLSMMMRLMTESVTELAYAVKHNKVKILTEALRQMDRCKDTAAKYEYIKSDKFYEDTKLPGQLRDRVKDVFGEVAQENYDVLCNTCHLNLVAVELERRTEDAGLVDGGKILLINYPVLLKTLISIMSRSGSFPSIKTFDVKKIDACFAELMKSRKSFNSER